MADISVRAVLESNTTLNDLFTTVDGVVLAEGDYVLATAQSSAINNGVWIAHDDDVWTRPTEGIDYRKGFEARVLEGDDNELALWIQNNDGMPDTSPTTFQKESIGRVYVAGTSLYITGNEIGIDASGVESGTYELASLTIESTGLISNAVGSNVGASFMEGLAFKYLNATQVQLQPGTAYIPGINRTIYVGGTITSNVVAGANAITYLYLYETNNVGQFELSSTAPDAPYQGHARYKTGDQTRRFIGYVKNDAAGNLIPFNCEVLAGNIYKVTYGLPPANLQVVNAFTGSTTLQTTYIGPTAATAANRLTGPSAMSAFIYWITSGAGGTKAIGYRPTAGDPPRTLPATGTGYDWVDIGDTHELNYKLANASDSISLHVMGFVGRR